MQGLQQEKGKHCKRKSGLAAGEYIHGERRASMTTRYLSYHKEEMDGERKASMTPKEKHEAKKGMHGRQDFITKLGARKQNSEV